MTSTTFRPTRRSVHVDHFTCTICGYPSLSIRGSRLHHTLSHGRNSFADRNWGIFEMAVHDRFSIAETADAFGVSEATVRRIVHRGLSWPGVFELATIPRP